MNRIARLIGSPFAFGTGIFLVMMLLGLGGAFGSHSSLFNIARHILVLATGVGLIVILWSGRVRARRLARKIDQLRPTGSPRQRAAPPKRSDRV